MSDSLTQKFQKIFKFIAGSKQLNEENLSSAVRDVRLALLEADVHYGVASQFIKRVKEAAVGQNLLKSVSPSQQFAKIVHEELIKLMGGEEKSFSLDAPPRPVVIMLCGLQGAGKTTQCAKLALYLKKKGIAKSPLMVACDLQRPAAVEQLARLAGQIEVPLFTIAGESSPLRVAEAALQKAREGSHDLLLVDTAGRLHLDEELMQQLIAMKQLLQPKELLFVANAATGQDAVKVAAEFDEKVGITGAILTMLDGTARAGVAISFCEITHKPIYFEGFGEGVDHLRPFHPRSMADRILGMGDIINLVRRAQEQMDGEQENDMEEKLRKASFTYSDYLRQMAMMKRMGSLRSLLKMLPGAGNLEGLELSEQQMKKTEAIILSMTPAEREERIELDVHRRHRLAKGSGTTVDEVNRLVKSFRNSKKFIKQNMPAMRREAAMQMKRMDGKKEMFPWH